MRLRMRVRMRMRMREVEREPEPHKRERETEREEADLFTFLCTPSFDDVHSATPPFGDKHKLRPGQSRVKMTQGIVDFVCFLLFFSCWCSYKTFFNSVFDLRIHYSFPFCMFKLNIRHFCSSFWCKYVPNRISSVRSGGFTGTRGIFGGSTELIQVSGTGTEVVPNLPKCRAPVLRRYRIY